MNSNFQKSNTYKTTRSKRKDILEIKKYPETYQKYLEKEMNLAVKFTKQTDKILDVGCGTGRIIPFIKDNVNEYTGVDIDNSYINKCKMYSIKYPNVRILKVDARHLSKKFEPEEFNKTICLWNTIGCVKDDKKVMKEMSTVTKDCIFFTVMAKGTLEKRKLYYDKLGIPYVIDEKNETIKSDEWNIVRAYSKKDIKILVKGSKFRISKILLLDKLAYAIWLKN